MALGASALLLTVALFVLGGIKLASKEPVPEAAPAVAEEHSEWLAKATRATGDQYLLGVGKADITGYASHVLGMV